MARPPHAARTSRAERARLVAVASVVAWAAASAPAQARAEASSWLSLSAGGARLRWAGQPDTTKVAMPLNLGVGTTPSWPVMVGLGFRLSPYFGAGTDFAAYARSATQGYVVGGFGVALDAGAYARSFGGGSTGFLGAFNLGVPWGGVVTVMFERGSNEAQMVGATVGIDFLRLTVYRLSGEQEWANPNPAYRP